MSHVLQETMKRVYCSLICPSVNLNAALHSNEYLGLVFRKQLSKNNAEHPAQFEFLSFSAPSH